MMDSEQLIEQMQAIQKMQEESQRMLAELHKNVVQYEGGSPPQPPNLENVIGHDFSETKGEITMAKFKERVKTGIDSNGNPIYEWATGDTKEQLHAAIVKLLTAPPKIKNQKTPREWSEYAQVWFDVFHKPNVRATTAVKDASLLRRHVKPAFAGRDISTITTAEIQTFLKSKSSYSHSHIRDLMWMMRAIFSSAVEDGVANMNPMNSDRIYNTSKQEGGGRLSLSPEDQADIISHISDLPEANERRYMGFLMYTSMRPCEILGLKWEDVDLDRRMITIKRNLVFVNGVASIGDTKTKESKREIPIDPALFEILKPFETDGFIICLTSDGRQGEHISSSSVMRSMWDRIKNTINIHGMTPYVGRHTFATNMSRAGVPMKTAMTLMGHKDERMLLRTYTHVDQADILKAGKTLTEYISTLNHQNSGAM